MGWGVWVQRLLILRSWRLFDFRRCTIIQPVDRTRGNLGAVRRGRLLNHELPVLVFKSLDARLELSLQMIAGPCHKLANGCGNSS